MKKKITKTALKKCPEKPLRAAVEIGFIIFLFYSNLLMSEFTRSNSRFANGFWWAVEDIFTLTNFLISLVLACVGYLVVSLLRKL